MEDSVIHYNAYDEGQDPQREKDVIMEPKSGSERSMEPGHNHRVRFVSFGGSVGAALVRR